MPISIKPCTFKELEERESKQRGVDYSFLNSPVFSIRQSAAESLAQLGVYEITLVREDGVELPRIFVAEIRDEMSSLWWEEGAGGGKLLVKARFYNEKGEIIRESKIYPPIPTGKDDKGRDITPGISICDLRHPFF